MISESEFTAQQTIEIAKKMAIAARTAPKGRGRNTVDIKIASGAELETIAIKMEEIGTRSNQQFFLRDAENIRNSHAILLIGSEIKTLGLNEYGLCVLTECRNKEKT